MVDDREEVFEDEELFDESEEAIEDAVDEIVDVETIASKYQVSEEFVEIAKKYKAGEELADDELDLIADTAIEILRQLLDFFDAGDADIDEYEGSEGELILDINNVDLAILIGRHGRTLEAFQYIFSILVNHKLGFRYPVMIDIEGYKNRRRQKLESIAHNSANKAMQRKCDVRMHPMKAYERRIVHLILRNVPGVTTHSEGVEPNRYVVVSPKRR